MGKSKIEWTEKTWNPVVGCSKLSSGCDNCYAEKMHRRLNAMGLEKYSEPFNVVRLHEPSLSIPIKTKKPTVFFVNSMSDLFHSDLDSSDLLAVWATMMANPRHIFLILTKRPLNVMVGYLQDLWTDNIWLGVTIESAKYIHRAETLQKIPAKHKFISFEPLIGSPLIPGVPVLCSNRYKVDWIIVGGETGSKARDMHIAWVSVIRDFAENEGIPFFFKSWGSYPGKTFAPKDAFIDGKEYKQFPPEIEKLMEAKKKK